MVAKNQRSSTATGLGGSPLIGSPEQGNNEGIEDLLAHLTEQAVAKAKPVGSARKAHHDKTVDEKKKEVLDSIQEERERHPKKTQWRGDAVNRSFNNIVAGYNVSLDPKGWKYETIKTRINPDAKQTFKGPSHTSEEFGDGAHVPITPALTELLVKNHKKFLAHVSRRRVEERLLPIPRCFDLAVKMPPWSAPPTQCRFFGSPEKMDANELQRQRQVQTARFKVQSKK